MHTYFGKGYIEEQLNHVPCVVTSLVRRGTWAHPVGGMHKGIMTLVHLDLTSGCSVSPGASAG